MADRHPSRPPRTNWGNLSKNLALWLLVGLLALALFQMMSRQRNPTQEFSYTEFSRQLDQGNVARVEVFDGKRLEGKHILLVEDIIDTGKTLQRLMALLGTRKPGSLAICALLDKQLAVEPCPELRFVGFRAPPAFLVGYGLDHAENYRHLPFIADLE